MNLLLLFGVCFIICEISAAPTKADRQKLNKEIQKLRKLLKTLKKTVNEGKAVEKQLQSLYATKTNEVNTKFNSHLNFLKKKQNGMEKVTYARLRNGVKAANTSLTKTCAGIINEGLKRSNGILVESQKSFKQFFTANKPVATDLRSSSDKAKSKVIALLLELDEKIEEQLKKKNGALDGVAADLHLLSRQVQLQQFNELEKARSDGKTGIKQIQTYKVGQKNYVSTDHNGMSFAGISDHEYTSRTLGIGEFVAVINGIEFRVNSGSYDLRKPVENDKTFHKTENIPFPDVPGEVKQTKDIKAQTEEMRKWFKAFQNQDSSEVDYKQHFTPVLSYLEGAWVTDKEDNDLHEKVQYSSNTGLSQAGGKIEYLPSTIMGFNGKKPTYSQWNYRILSHLLTNDLPKRYLKPFIDPVTQRRIGLNHQQYLNSYSARFDMQGLKHDGERLEDRSIYYSYLDLVMEEIPGTDNYGALITADGFDAKILSAHPNRDGRSLNGAYYHCPYKLDSADAMGVDKANRGYSHRFYAALNAQSRISGPKYMATKQNGKQAIEYEVSAKVSYAVPFEIVYTTPLSKWNPYKINFVKQCGDIGGTGTKKDPFTAYCSELHFTTPNSFFTGNDECEIPDNGDDLFYFASPESDEPVCLRASGIRVVFPNIYGVSGYVRQRYPIMTVNGEGSSAWKKLNAIEDSIDLYGDVSERTRYRTGQSTSTSVPFHSHIVVISKDQRDAIMDNGKVIVKPTEPDDKHRHILTLAKRKVDNKDRIVVTHCDSDKDDQPSDKHCWDGHHHVVIEIDE